MIRVGVFECTDNVIQEGTSKVVIFSSFNAVILLTHRGRLEIVHINYWGLSK